jgi:hypothetical protein
MITTYNVVSHFIYCLRTVKIMGKSTKQKNLYNLCNGSLFKAGVKLGRLDLSRQLCWRVETSLEVLNYPKIMIFVKILIETLDLDI